MKRLLTFAFPVVLALSAATPTAVAQTCASGDDCFNECYFQCIKSGHGHNHCTDVICAQVVCP